MRAIAARDAGLALANRIKRWVFAGALALSGLFSLLAAQAFHGHVRSGTASAVTSGSSTRAHRHAEDGGGGLAQPSAAPTPTPAPAPAAPAPVVSGGS
jgi:hypothetical protein